MGILNRGDHLNVTMRNSAFDSGKPQSLRISKRQFRYRFAAIPNCSPTTVDEELEFPVTVSDLASL